MAFPVSAARIVESQLTEQNIQKWEAREIRYHGNVAKLLWGGKGFYQHQQRSIAARVFIAANFLRDKIVINLSIHVKKIPRMRVRNTRRGAAGSGYIYVPPESRSKPGEFPRADSTDLLK